MATRATIGAITKNLQYLQHYARGQEEQASAAAALARVKAIDATYGNLMDAIDAADPDAASAILARMIHERTPKGAKTA